jgi:hypothetical protein
MFALLSFLRLDIAFGNNLHSVGFSSADAGLSWISIVLLCLQVAIFALRFIYSAIFELRDPWTQPEGYGLCEEGVEGVAYMDFAVLCDCAMGKWLVYFWPALGGSKLCGAPLSYIF